MSDQISIILGTRGSALALAQADLTTATLAASAPDVAIERQVIKTTGDVRLDIALTSAVTANADGGAKLDKGLFTKEIETELLAERIDIAVHSLKDLPTTMPDGLMLAAVLPREATDDVLITCDIDSLDELQQGATVATGSERRRLQLLQLRPDLRVVGIRGNVPTRLRKLTNNGEWSGIILARAGLNRLGYDLGSDRLVVDGAEYRFDFLGDRMLPAPGQAAVGLQCRTDDVRVRDLLSAINHPETWACVTAERALLRSLGGGCQMPLGVKGEILDGVLTLRAELFTTTDSADAPLRAEISGAPDAAVALGEHLLEKLYGR